MRRCVLDYIGDKKLINDPEVRPLLGDFMDTVDKVYFLLIFILVNLLFVKL